MDTRVILICSVHGAAIGPFEDVELAIKWMKESEDAEENCSLDLMPLYAPDQPQSYEPKGYL